MPCSLKRGAAGKVDAEEESSPCDKDNSIVRGSGDEGVQGCRGAGDEGMPTICWHNVCGAIFTGDALILAAANASTQV